jgi:hypothetical protein
LSEPPSHRGFDQSALQPAQLGPEMNFPKLLEPLAFLFYQFFLQVLINPIPCRGVPKLFPEVRFAGV